MNFTTFRKTKGNFEPNSSNTSKKNMEQEQQKIVKVKVTDKKAGGAFCNFNCQQV